MCKLTESPQPNASTIGRYLVKSRADVRLAIGQSITEGLLSTSPRVIGKDYLPNKYPYVLVTYANYHLDTIDLNAVTLGDFKE